MIQGFCLFWMIPKRNVSSLTPCSGAHSAGMRSNRYFAGGEQSGRSYWKNSCRYVKMAVSGSGIWKEPGAEYMYKEDKENGLS